MKFGRLNALVFLTKPGKVLGAIRNMLRYLEYRFGLPNGLAFCLWATIHTWMKPVEHVMRSYEKIKRVVCIVRASRKPRELAFELLKKIGGCF